MPLKRMIDTNKFLSHLDKQLYRVNLCGSHSMKSGAISLIQEEIKDYQDELHREFIKHAREEERRVMVCVEKMIANIQQRQKKEIPEGYYVITFNIIEDELKQFTKNCFPEDDGIPF